MSRESVLARIRAALADAGEPGPVPRDYARTGDLAAGSPAVVELLIDRLEDYKATVRRVSSPGRGGDSPGDSDPKAGSTPLRPGDGDLAIAVSEALGPARSVVVPAGLDAELAAAAAADGRMVTVDDGLLTADDLDRIDAVITRARVAIAVTGTIILDASPDQGRRAITLVPDRHVVVLEAGQVVHTVPEGLADLIPTRPLTLVSGPSATSDIELSRVEGVHGPRTLEVIILG